jgi:hypothetical protein
VPRSDEWETYEYFRNRNSSPHWHTCHEKRAVSPNFPNIDEPMSVVVSAFVSTLIFQQKFDGKYAPCHIPNCHPGRSQPWTVSVFINARAQNRTTLAKVSVEQTFTAATANVRNPRWPQPVDVKHGCMPKLTRIGDFRSDPPTFERSDDCSRGWESKTLDLAARSDKNYA